MVCVGVESKLRAWIDGLRGNLIPRPTSPPNPLSNFAAPPLVERGSEMVFPGSPLSTQRSEAGEGGRGGEVGRKG